MFVCGITQSHYRNDVVLTTAQSAVFATDAGRQHKHRDDVEGRVLQQLPRALAPRLGAHSLITTSEWKEKWESEMLN